MLSSQLVKVLWKAFIFIILGMAFLNLIFICIAVVYLLFTVLGSWTLSPKRISVTRKRDEIKSVINRKVDVESSVSVGGGVGIVTVADELPKHFALVKWDDLARKEGSAKSNFRVFWKGRTPLNIDMVYGIILTKRGIYEVPPLHCESINATNFRSPETISAGAPLRIMVMHSTLNIRKMRDPRLLARIPMPMGAMTRLGMSTNEFRELREYTAGDPYNKINWKATARLSSCKPNSPPLVNEYEHEGKKTVWIFVDSSTRMRLGTEIENIFEHAIRAVSGISQFYLARNCRVGLSVYNSGETILPDTGRRQEFKISRTLLELELSVMSRPLNYAINKLHGHLIGQNPLYIIITMVNRDNINELLEGIKKLRIYSIAGRSQVIVVHLMGYDMVANNPYDASIAQLLDFSILPSLRALRRTGAFVVPWDSKTQVLQRLMVIGAKRR